MMNAVTSSSTPTAAGQIAGLARLAGTDPGPLPPPGLDRDLRRVGLIVAAQQKGATWTRLSMVLFGYEDPKAAKRAVQKLARETQRAALLRQNTETAQAG